LWFTPISSKPILIDFLAAFILTFFSSKILSEDLGTVSLMSKIFPFFNNKITWLPIAPTMTYEKDLNKEDLRKKYNLADDVFYLSFFGYRYPSKGVDILLKAVEKINSTHTKNTKKIKILMVGGHDPKDYTAYDKQMIKLSLDLGMEDDIIYTGKIEDRIINEYLKVSDLYVTPFRRFFTGRSSILSPIYLSMPYLASMKKDKNGPFKHKRNCYIVRPDSVESLALGIQEMANNESLRLSCQENIGDLRKTFNWSVSEAIMLEKS
jgi:glycosyltransferase involved in cell wall biosynthesis